MTGQGAEASRFAGRWLVERDRACLALGRRLRVPVLTSDRTWRSLKLGVKVRPIR